MIQYTSERLRMATYSNGQTGKGISKIDNYYYAYTSDTKEGLPDTSNDVWKTNISDLTKPFDKDNKYLWNFERITYTDNTETDTDATMIAIYSSDGRGITGVYEFYILTKTSSPPELVPTMENSNGWTPNGDGTIPVPNAEKPFLWNYEIIDYTEGDDTGSGPVCIGQYGNSIAQVQEWYMATETSTKPTNQNGAEGGWVSEITDTGHCATKPYLWNYEETTYSAAASVKSPITLLAASPRTIETITEYYQQLPVNYNTPSGVIWQEGDDKHNESPDVPEDWSTTRGKLDQGKYMWNLEVIKFQAVDAEGKNLYTATKPAIAGYAGVDGASAKDFNITASSYAFVKAKEEDETYKNSITLTAHKLNIGGDVYWQKKVGENFVDIQENGENATGNTYTPTGPGTYRGVIYKSDNTNIEWFDEVVLVETVDGATGKNAIAIVLSNPTIVFHGNTNGESESCEVIVYEGGTLLTYNKDIATNSTFKVEKADDQDEVANVRLENGIITIADKAENGSYKITVSVKTSTGETSSQDFTIKWKVVYDGTSPYTLSLDEDFSSIPAKSDGTLFDTNWSTTVTPSVYLGQENQSWSNSSGDTDTGLNIHVSSSNLKCDYNSSGNYTITWNTGDKTVNKGTVTFTLRNGANNIISTTYEAVKQLQGDNGKYIYALAEPNVIRKDNETDIIVQLYERVGSGNPALVEIDSSLKCILVLDGEEQQNAITHNNNKFTITKETIKGKGKIQLIISTNNIIDGVIDKITIETVQDGEDGIGEYILYHEASDNIIEFPTTMDYYSDDFIKNSGADGAKGWYRTQDDQAVWMTRKTCRASEQDGVAWTIKNKIEASAINYSDLYSALDKLSTEDEEKSGIYALGDGYIGVNADIIQTGALRVGTASDEEDKPWKNAKFYADIDDNSGVYVGGWQVTENSIQKTGIPSSETQSSPITFDQVNYETLDELLYDNIQSSSSIYIFGGAFTPGVLTFKNGEWVTKPFFVKDPQNYYHLNFYVNVDYFPYSDEITDYGFDINNDFYTWDQFDNLDGSSIMFEMAVCEADTDIEIKKVSFTKQDLEDEGYSLTCSFSNLKISSNGIYFKINGSLGVMDGTDYLGLVAYDFIFEESIPSYQVMLAAKEGNIAYNAIDIQKTGISKFRVTNEGDLYASSAHISGEGTIGSFYINNYLTSNRNKTTYNNTTYDGVFLGSTGIGLGKGKFTVSNTGYLTSTSGYIGGFYIGSYLTSNVNKKSYNDTTYDAVFLGSGGIGLGKGTFTVNNYGYLTSTSGKIGGFEIGSKSILNKSQNDDDQSVIGLRKYSGTTETSYGELRYTTQTVTNASGTTIFNGNAPVLALGLTAGGTKRSVSITPLGFLQYYESNTMQTGFQFKNSGVIVLGKDGGMGKLQAQEITTRHYGVASDAPITTEETDHYNTDTKKYRLYIQRCGGVVIDVWLGDPKN